MFPPPPFESQSETATHVKSAACLLAAASAESRHQTGQHRVESCVYTDPKLLVVPPVWRLTLLPIARVMGNTKNMFSLAHKTLGVCFLYD